VPDETADKVTDEVTDEMSGAARSDREHPHFPHLPHVHLTHPHLPHMILNRKRVLIGSIVALVLATTLSFLIANPTARDSIQGLDERIWSWAEDHRTETVTQLLELFTNLGGPVVSWTLRIGAIAMLLFRRRYLQIAAFTLAIVTSELCIGPLKALVERPRPPGAVVATTGYSYPSGHAIAIAVTAIGLVIALFPPGRARLRWEILAGVVTFITSLSRVYLGAHWFTDILGGSLIGCGLALFWPAFFEELRWRFRHQDHDVAPGDAPVVATTDAGISSTSPRAT
jgi:undecaprenyl-diphosphatase